MIPRIAPTVCLALLLAGCASSSKETTAKAPFELTERAVPTAPVSAPDPGAPAGGANATVPAEPENAFGPELPPEELKDKLGITAYKFTPRSEADGTNASISLTLENLQDKGDMVYELAARFHGANGDGLVQTEWTRVTLKPRKRFFYKSESSDLRTASARVLIRRIEDGKS